MSIHDIDALKALEAKYRGLAIKEGLLEAAEALAAEAGVPKRPSRSYNDSVQYPFERALAEHFGAMEARYGSLFEGAPDALIVTDRAGSIIFANSSVARNFGYERADLLAKALPLLIEGAIVGQIMTEGAEAAVTAAADQAMTGLELTGIRSDGSRFPIEGTFSLVDTDDNVVLVADLRDIGARKAAERQLINEELRSRTLIDQAPAGILLVNRRGRIVRANAEAERIMGYDREELNGQTASAVLPGELVDEMLAAIERADAESGSTGAAPLQLYRGRSKGGAEFALEATISTVQREQGWVAVAALRAADMPGAGVLADAHSELRSHILEAAPDAIVAVDLRGDIVLMNAEAEKYFGHSRDDLIGQPIVRILPDGFLERMAPDPLSSTEAALARELGTGIELIGERKDGSRFPLEIMLARLELDDPLMIATLRDASVKRAVAQRAGAGRSRSVGSDPRQSQASRQNEELQQFPAFVTQQLQEPLRMVESYARLLADRYGERFDPDAKDFIGYISAGTRQMQRLVRDLQAYCGLDTANMHADRIATSDVLEQVLSALRPEMAESGATVTHGELPEVSGDHMHLVQLFQSIIGNAIKYRGATPPAVNVSATRVPPNFWQFTITDNGAGIDRHELERIFVLFQRLDPHGPIPGSGIGLAAARKIVDRHGGRISAVSEKGKGSAFHFTLREWRPA